MNVTREGSFESVPISRRQAIQGILSVIPVVMGLSGCERHRYIRPAEELDLGTVKSLLYARVHKPITDVLVFRDVDGWSALSTRCSYRGCGLTYQEPVLLCSCCKTRFNMEGVPIGGGPAKRNLPWMEVIYRDGHLYGNPGKIKPRSFRFTTQRIEEAVRKLRERVKTESLDDEVKIPGILTGKGDGEFGGMFLEDDPNYMDELKMIR